MNIKENKVDALNTIVSISITPEDYKDKVEQTLKDYKKKMNMPGFRQGQAPMSIVKKQYEKAVSFEEINKVLSDNLNKFISENKLAILGQPLPKEREDLDFNATELVFDFELGLAPEFDVDLKKIKAPYYKIEATEEEINDTLDRMRNQFGETIPAKEVVKGGHFVADVTEVFEDGGEVEGGIKTTVTFLLDDLRTPDLFLGKKENDVVEIYAQELFNDVHNLQHFLGLSHDEAHHYNGKLHLDIKEISAKTQAELNQEFFDKIYGKDKITSVEELKTKIKEEMENYYKRETDNYFMNKTVDELLEKVSFDLPEAFLTKYLQSTAKEPMSDEDAKEEFKKSEKALRYQLIEGKILSANNVNVQFGDLMEHTKNQMKQQFAMYGYADVPEEELNKYAENALKNEEQLRRSSNELIQQKLFEIVDKEVNKEEKNITLKEFDELLKSENETEDAHEHEHHH